MKVVVTGGRNFRSVDAHLLRKALNDFHSKTSITTLIHGGAKGVDSIAGAWALSRNIEVIIVQAEWNKYGKRAGPKRNKQMLKMKPDVVLAAPGGFGTKNCVMMVFLLD